MKKVYLDIDGVLLANDKQAANYAAELIEFLVNNYDVYWLTTHCRGGENYAIELLSPFFDAKTIELLKKIKPTNWNEAKTEVIDFNSDFLWLDDHLFEDEELALRQHNKLDSLIRIDLSKDVDQLKKVIDALGVDEK